MSTKYNVIAADGSTQFTSTKKTRALQEYATRKAAKVVTDKGTVIVEAPKPKAKRRPKIDVPAGHRHCGRCKTIKPLSDFAGQAAWCKSCWNAHAKAKREVLRNRSADELAAAKPQSKTCSRCKQSKPAADFGNAKSYRDGLSPWCKSCTSEYRKSKKAA